MDITSSSLHDRLGNISNADTVLVQDCEENSAIKTEVSDSHGTQLVQRCVIIQRDEKGYGLTVSGDNPVFVRSVRQDGAAAKAGVQKGDRIIKVNGTLVTQSNHQEVVKLIKSVPYVALILLGKPSPGSRLAPTPPPLSLTSNLHNYHGHNRSPSERITGPQPVNPEIQQEVENERIGTIRKMLEQELIFVENLKSELIKTPSDKLQAEMNGAAKRVKTLEEQLFNLTRVHQNISPSCSPRSPPVRRYTHSEKENSRYSPITQHIRSLSHQISAPTLPKADWNIITCSVPDDTVPSSELQSKTVKGNGHVLNQAQKSLPLSCSLENISKQPSSKGSSWPSRGSNHSRQSSNPDTLIHHIEDFLPPNKSPLSSPESQSYNINNQHSSARKCTASESFHEFEVGRRWKSTRLSKGSASHADYTPPGTPPPDICSDNIEYKDGCNGEDNTCFEEENFIESSVGSEEMTEGSEFNTSDNKPLLPDQKLSTPLSSPSQSLISPDSQTGNNSHSSNLRWSGQQPYIIGMEDDDFPSDTEMGQVEDHGPFKSMWSLMQNPAHLAVFIHYLMSNNDPSGLFFYLISDIYEQGTVKEMKKWAYEIHSSFLLPGAPLRIKNIDEAILNEIDDVLQHQLEKEEIIRVVFKKAREKAKKELKDLLADFRNKRALGLGNIYGPPDCQLELALHDKNKELKIIEQLLLPTVETIPEDLESASDKILATASAVATILKQFGSKSPHVINVTDRCPTFVAKEKTRLRFLQRNKKVMFVQGHQFLPQHYHCVTYCNHCQLIIWGIGNQGYQCQNCEMNIHKYCVKIVEEHCIGALRNKKDKKNYSVTGIVENIIGKTRKPSQPYPGAIERAKKINEEGSNIDLPTANITNIEPVTESGEKAINTGRSERGSEDLSPPLAPISNLEVDILAKKATSIGRSESFRQRRENKPPFRKRSDPNIPRSKSDVEVDDKSSSNLNYSGSSSNSSLSARSLDSPSNSIEMVHRTPTSTPADALPGSGPTSGLIQPHIPTTISLDQYNDSDLEAEVDPPNWQDNIEWEVIRLMKPKEKKRQDVINELFHTEKTHVRNLKILDRLFYRPMQQEQLLPPDLLQLLFPNLEEMLEIHGGFNNKMKAKRREEPIIGDVGEMMLNMLDGESGENLMTATSKFCRNQSVALETLKNRQKKDQKLSQFLADAEAQFICRRLQLKDIIATGFQRLTKYPLLLENIAKHTPVNAIEYTNLLHAVDCSKRILAHVNQAVKEADNQHHLSELQRKLDRSAFDKVDNKITQNYKNLDLTKHKLLYDGHLTWRLNKQKTVEMHIVLLEDILVLLQKQDEKYILKFHNTNLMTGREDTKLTHSPILRVQNLFTRNVATDKSAFFLVSASDQHAIYEFVASSPSEKKMWLRYISEATEVYKGTANQRKNPQSSPVFSDRLESSEIKDDTEKELHTREDSQSEKFDGIEANDSCELPQFPSSESSIPLSPPTTSISAECDSPQKESIPSLEDSKTTKSEQTIIQGHIVQIVDSPGLIEPSEVIITESAPLEVAEPVLTPMEQLRRKDQEIAAALTEKQELVADILQIPKGEFEHFAEMANEVDGDKDAKELILAAIYQANKLTALVNDTFTCSEESLGSPKTELASPNESSEAVIASLPQMEEKTGFPKLASPEKLKNISYCIDRQLTKLLGIITEQEEERKQMRKELRCMQEQIHFLHDAHRRCSTRSQSPSNPSIYSRPSSFISIASSTSEGQCELLEPIQNIVLQQTNKTQEEKQDISTEDRETLDHEEMFVDAPSGECPVLINSCKVTDLDNETETDESKSVNKACEHDVDEQPSLPSNDDDGKSEKNNIAYF